MNLKRFITVDKEFSGELKQIVRNAIIQRVDTDLYDYIKSELTQKQITHHDEKQTHPSHLRHQGGYFSLYFDVDKREWMHLQH